MPSMTWFGRRWRMAADELFFPLGFNLMFSSASTVLILCTLDLTGPENRKGRSSYLPHCPQSSDTLETAFLSLGVINGLMSVSLVVTMLMSLRGAIFELSKRRRVGIGLYAVLLWTLLIGVMTIFCSVYVWGKRELQYCTCPGLQLALIFCLCLCGFILLFLVTAFDSVKRSRYEALDKYSKVWWKRLRILCCGCKADKEEEDAYESAASVLAQSFRGYDIVISDVVAGVLLLNGYHTTSLRNDARGVRYPHHPEGLTEKRTVQSVQCKPIDVTLVHRLQAYSKFYMASYGWMLQQYINCCSGACSVYFSDPCMCCRHHVGKHYGTSTYCDLSAALLVTGLEEQHLLVSQWSSDVYKPVHYVAYDPDTNSVIVAIRGTQSLADCVTDFAALPRVVELSDPDDRWAPEDYFVHGGMHESALNVLHSLEYYGVLDSVLSGKYKDCPFVVLGHSLGAGVSIILSIILWSRCRELRSRLQCLAYSPPGGLLSEAMVEYSKDFTLGCFVGQDMIPRIAMHTINQFREDMFDVMAASTSPKSLLFLKCFQTQSLVRDFHPASPRALECNIPLEAAKYRESLRVQSTVPHVETKKLYPCKRLIHFRKVVERTVPSCLCCHSTQGVYVPVMEGPEDVQFVVAAPSMFADHFPDVLFRVLEEVSDELDSGELDRYFSSASRTTAATQPISVHIPALDRHGSLVNA